MSPILRNQASTVLFLNASRQGLYWVLFKWQSQTNRQTSTFHERTPLVLIQGCQIRGGPICQHTMPWKSPIIPLSFQTDYDTVRLFMIVWFWFRTGVRIIIYHPRVNMSDAQYLNLNKSLRSDHTFHRFPLSVTHYRVSSMTSQQHSNMVDSVVQVHIEMTVSIKHNTLCSVTWNVDDPHIVYSIWNDSIPGYNCRILVYQVIMYCAKVQTTKELGNTKTMKQDVKMLTFPNIHNTFQLSALSNKSFLIKSKVLLSRVTELVSQKHLTNLTISGVKESGSLTIMTVNMTSNVRQV